jgi:hypothetical protein
MSSIVTKLYSFWFSSNQYDTDEYGRFTYYKQQIQPLKRESPVHYIQRIRKIQYIWQLEPLGWLCNRMVMENITNMFYTHVVRIDSFHSDITVLKTIGDFAKENNQLLFRDYEEIKKIYDTWCYGRRVISNEVRRDFEEFPYFHY